jgi:signal transduction histidine kinase/DNA-binding response OmpR family regulator
VGSKVISGIQEDKDGTIWLATDGAGIFLFDKQSNSVTNLLYKEGKKGTISTNGLFSMLIDRDDIVWVGTYKQGLDFYKPSSKKFRLIQNDPEIDNSLSLNDVDCCIEDDKGNIWIGTNGGGINILDKNTRKFRYITVANTKPNGLSSDIVVSLYEDYRKNIWMGTYFGGLNKYNPETGKFTVYKYNATDSTSISDDRIWSIAADSENRLWVGTLGGGVNVFNPKTESFRRYNNENSNLSGNYINHILLDSKKQLWICTTDGLSIYDPKKDDFDSYFTKFSTNGTPFLGPISSSFEDSRGWHWLCSINGLVKFSPENLSTVVIDKNSGLVANPVYRALEDNQGNLWVSSSRGITKIHFSNIENDTTFTTTLMHFDETDGLQGLEFSETASLKTRDGELLFGGVNGLNIFRSEEIKIDRTIPQLIFTNLRVLNSNIVPGQVFNNRVLLKQPLNHTGEIVLKYSENLFSVEFAALTYLYPEKNTYRYQLEGFDNSWFETDGTANFATFTNLNNGDYVLHLQGSNADGTWNRRGISLKIKVLPPFWKSWYALVIYVLVLAISLLVLRYTILFRERMNVQLEVERSEARRIHELDNLKLKFFTNISHEFRTPLTLILSPVEKLLPHFKGKPEEKYLHHIHQNSTKLMNMINQLLDFRKMDDKGLSYNPSWGNIIEFITETVASFNDLSENKSIELRQITDLREFHMMFDKDKLEKVLFNLLSNAFKYTPISGLVIVQVSLESGVNEDTGEKQNNLVIRVKDNGVGIQPENLDKIFTRFYQETTTNGGREKGTGIGLSLVKEYVQLHGGKVTVESAPNIGSCFNVYLPVIETTELDSHVVRGAIREVKFVPKKELSTKQEKRTEFAVKSESVLIVEDNEELRQYLKENMEEAYEVMEAANGRQALEKLEKTLPDLILSDIMMPEMDGVELCRQVKGDKITSHIPFIFLTAKISEQHKLEGLHSGADDYIVKPFNFEILQAKIQNLIQLKKNIREVFKSKMNIEPKDISITSLDEKFMAKALDIIEEHMADTSFSVAEFGRQMGISRMQLYNKIVALTGNSPLEFIRILRLKRAAQLLQKSQLSVSEVAYQVGFNDPKYFSMHFKKEFKILPSKYRELNEA